MKEREIQHFTTIDESKFLLNLGVKPEKNLLAYDTKSNTIVHYKDNENLEHIVPIWSVWDLIELLPTTIKIKGYGYILEFNKDYIEYASLLSLVGGKSYVFERNTMKENCIDCITWLIKHMDFKLANEKFEFKSKLMDKVEEK